MTAFGNPTNAIPIGGYGTFDGVMLNSFSRPRIEGTFAGERMRAFDVDWGSGKGHDGHREQLRRREGRRHDVRRLERSTRRRPLLARLPAT